MTTENAVIYSKLRGYSTLNLIMKTCKSDETKIGIHFFLQTDIGQTLIKSININLNRDFQRTLKILHLLPDNFINFNFGLMKNLRFQKPSTFSLIHLGFLIFTDSSLKNKALKSTEYFSDHIPKLVFDDLSDLFVKGSNYGSHDSAIPFTFVITHVQHGFIQYNYEITHNWSSNFVSKFRKFNFS